MLKLIAGFLTSVWGLSLVALLVLLYVELRRGRTVEVAELPLELRRQLERWCSRCQLTHRVCDLHPRTAFEACDCGEGVPRPCPECKREDYNPAALLEEIARLRNAGAPR